MRYLIALLTATLLAGCSSEPGADEWDRYVNRCHDKGGIVGKHGDGWAINRLSCHGDTEQPLLPELAV